MTKNKQARIDVVIEPMEALPVKKDDFENVIIAIYSYISILIYILPMYSYILRIQTEKQSGVKRHLSIVGLSYNAQTLAMWISYSIQITFISIAILLTMWIGGLFPKSIYNNWFLLFFFHWIQGMANFGFIIMICAILPQNMIPKIAAKWGTLIYFGSTFGDFMITKPAVDEQTKVIMSLIFPNLATARASRNLCIFEYSGGGTGLNYHHTLWLKYHNYRIITYFIVMIYAFFLNLTVGLLFEKYGSLPEIIKYLKTNIFGSKQKEKQLQNQQTQSSSQFPNDKYFENGAVEIFDEDHEQSKKMLTVEKLVKNFKQTQEKSTKKKQIKSDQVFTAVDNLSLKLWEDEIFCLLGHNGAGKTTTISMLTGMIEATSGKVKCFGKTQIDDAADKTQLKKDIEYIRQVMGICPQHDILFEQLTVEENLDIFCNFKGVDPSVKQQKIEKIMKDIDLESHRNTMAKSLSGGNKRKLSVALALVADSKLVLLDEPTSGMDLTARRRLWSLLKDYKKGRIIILTTHNMDEADLLGDKIGIMSQGRLQCLGSSSFLKKQFNQGFLLQIQTKSKNLNGADKISSYLKTELGADIAKLSQNQNQQYELVFEIPLQYGKQFEKFFCGFDQQRDKLDVQSYCLSVTSLEQIFLAVGEGSKQQQQTEPQFKESIELQKYEKGSLQEQVPLIIKENPRQDQNQEVSVASQTQIAHFRNKRTFFQILRSQMHSILKRKIVASNRSFSSTIFEIMVPVLLVAIGFTFGSLNFSAGRPIRQLSVDLYPARQRILVNQKLVVNQDSFTASGDVLQEDEDFDEQLEEDKQKLLKKLFNYEAESGDLSPQQIMENFDKFDKNKYDIEYLDVDEQMNLDREALNQALQNSSEQTEKKSMPPVGEDDAIQFTALNKVTLHNTFRNYLYNTRRLNETTFKTKHPVQEFEQVYPDRFGSYYIYEANNKTKHFKVAIFVNTTSPEVVPTFPFLMYDALLKTATGKQNLKFNFAHQPFPQSHKQKEFQDNAPGIFVCFVVGIAMSLIPASIASRVVSEREKGLYHMQVVSGVDLRAYWLSFFFFDLIAAYIPCILISILIDFFKMQYREVWKVLMLYPWAVIPYTYVFCFLYEREITAQTFTIYKHFLLSGIAGMVVFALRMVDQTAFAGDRIQWIMRCVCPTFQICNSIIYASNANLLIGRRRASINNYYRRQFVGKSYLWPRQISTDSLNIHNIGGDLATLALQSIVWWVIFILIEASPKGCLDQAIMNRKKMPKKLTNDELQLDQDVLQEELRIEQTPLQSQVCVNKFRKLYAVPWSSPILAVEKVSFSVDCGECFALLGVNGAGKSTTFKSLTNVIIPSEGLVTIAGKDIVKNFDAVRHLLGYCPQHNALFSSVTVVEHLYFYADLKGLPHQVQSQLIESAIQKLGLQKYLNKQADQLSGGNKRKLQVAIAILGNPKIILLDEPSAGMDPVSRRFMWQVIKSIILDQKESCIILTTHSMEEAEALSTKMAIMVRGGKFACFGTPQHIKNKFGIGYEIEVKLKKYNIKTFQKCQIELFEKHKNGAQDLKSQIQKSIQSGQIPLEDESKIEQIFIQTKHPLSNGQINTEHLKVSAEEYLSFLRFYQIQKQILNQLFCSFGQFDLLETYGHRYFKVRVPKNEHSIGSVFGLIETLNIDLIEEYSVKPTTLEVIFQFFADDGKVGKSNELTAKKQL